MEGSSHAKTNSIHSTVSLELQQTQAIASTHASMALVGRNGLDI